MRTVLVMCICIICASCINNDLKRFYNKEVTITKLDSWVSSKGNNRGTNVFNVLTHKLVIYINGDCGSCLDKIKHWDLFLNKEPWYSNVKPVFIISSNDNFELSKFVIERDSLSHHIYLLDYDKQFYQRNNMEEKCFEVFLLDEKNMIKLFGSPLINENINQTYLDYFK